MTAAHGPYAAWASWLDAFGRGEDLASRHLVPVGDTLGPLMQERILLRLKDAFEARSRLWGDRLQRHLDAVVVREPRELGAQLVAARGGLVAMRALANDPRLPEAVRTSMRDALRAMVESAQKSIEDSVRRHPRQAEALIAVLRENSLVAALSPAGMPVAAAAPAPPAPGRRVILWGN